jgi:hypothetical protein
MDDMAMTFHVISEGRPCGTEDLYRVPVQMVLVVTVKTDTGRKVDVVELQKVPGNHVLMLHMTLKVRTKRPGNRFVGKFPGC